MSLNYAEPEPFRSRRNPATRVLLQVARFAASVLGSVVVLAMILGAGYVVAGFIGVSYISLVLLMALVAAASARKRLHRRRVAAVLNTCARAMDAGLPLPEFLRAASSGEHGILKRRMLTISRELSAGSTVDRALGDSLPELDSRQASLLLAAAGNQSLIGTLDRLAEECSPAPEDVDAQRPSALLSAAWTLAVIGLVSGIFVFPKSARVFRDYGIPFRASMAPLIPAYLVLGGVGLVALYWIAERSISRLVTFRGTAGVESHRRGGWLGRWLPTPAYHRALADAYHIAADTISASRPINEALAWSQTSHDRSGVNERARKLLSAFDTSGGSNLAKALRAAGFPAGDAAFFGLAMTSPALAITFRFLAEHHDNAAHFARRKLADVASVAAVFAVAALIVPVILSVWMPLIDLLNLLVDHALKSRW